MAVSLVPLVVFAPVRVHAQGRSEENYIVATSVRDGEATAAVIADANQVTEMPNGHLRLWTWIYFTSADRSQLAEIVHFSEVD
jgi:hypothetical protein